MFKYEIKNRKEGYQICLAVGELPEAPPYWGKPERWVLHKDEEGAEQYDDSDVIETKAEVVQESKEAIPAIIDEQGNVIQEEQQALPLIIKKYVKLQAEYIIEVTDISYEHELSQVIEKRKAEYPKAEEFLNAFFDGGDAAIEDLKQKRLEIKAKYPKPVRE